MLRALFFILLLFLYVRIAFQAINAPIDYDEGYNLQVSYHLSKNVFNYATFSKKFDPNITTGPTVLLPAALLINDTSSLLPRVIMFLFTILFMYLCLHEIFETLWARVGFLITLLLMPLFSVFSAHILGELPGFFFLLLAIILLQKNKLKLSGIAFALSILTKQVYIFGVIPLFWLWFTNYRAIKQFNNKISGNLWNWASGFFSIIGIWFLYILTSLNFSWINVIRALDLYEQTARTISQPKMYLLIKRLDMLGYIFSLPGIIFLLLFIGIAIVTFIEQKKRNNILAALCIFTIIYTAYFMFFGSTNWYRHFFPAMLGFSIILPVFILSLLFSRSEKHTLALGILGVIIVINSLLYRLTTDSDLLERKRTVEQNLLFSIDQPLMPTTDPVLKSQLNTAEFIQEQVLPNDTIAGVGWWNAPEIEYLAKRRIERDPFQKNVKYIIKHFYGETLGQYDYRYLPQIQKYLIYKNNEYSIYLKNQ